MFRIMVIDSDKTNCDTLRGMLSSSYKLLFCTDPTKSIFQISASKPALILIHIDEKQTIGIELCQKIRAVSKTSRIPIVMISGKYDYSEEVRSFSAGAVDYIALPFSGESLMKRIDTHIALYNQQIIFDEKLKERTREIEQNQIMSLIMLADAGHFNDSESGVHIWRMAAYTGAIARAMGWSREDAHRLALGAALHDTGKIGIPVSVLKKPAKLSDDEFSRIKDHTEIGYSILHHTKHPGPVFEYGAQIAKHHHERWDGTGYPSGLSGTMIPISARIAAVADVFDSLTMKRVYKKVMSSSDAFQVIEDEAGTHFDPEVVKVFRSIRAEIEVLRDHWNFIERNNLLEGNLEELIANL